MNRCLPQLATHFKLAEVMLKTGESENEIVLRSDLVIKYIHQ